MQKEGYLLFFFFSFILVLLHLSAGIYFGLDMLLNKPSYDEFLEFQCVSGNVFTRIPNSNAEPLQVVHCKLSPDLNSLIVTPMFSDTNKPPITVFLDEIKLLTYSRLPPSLYRPSMKDWLCVSVYISDSPVVRLHCADKNTLIVWILTLQSLLVRRGKSLPHRFTHGNLLWKMWKIKWEMKAGSSRILRAVIHALNNNNNNNSINNNS